MKASMLLSPSIWDLLDRLRPHLDVVVDFFDPHFSALLPERDDDVAVAVRRLVASPVGTPVGSRLQAAVRTGQHQVLTAEGLVAAVFPLRHEREVVAVLVVARPVSDDLETGVLIDSGVERLGWSLRSTIEADIVTHEKLGDEERRSRWLSTILRFLEHLHHCGSQHDLFVTLVEGVAIWGDVDARVYRRGLDGIYSLDAALPSVLTDAAAPHRFPAALLGGHPPVTRVSSIAELEQLGWSTATGELLIIRAPARKSAEFLLAVAGAVNAEFERVLTIACQTLATCLETLATERARSLRERLLRALAESTLRFPAPATTLMGELATEVQAVHARLLLREGAGESPRTLAAIGGSPMSLLPSNLPETSSLERPDRIVVPVVPGSGSMAWLDLGSSPARKFTPGDAEVVEEAARTFSAWLIGALQSPAHHGSTVAASLAARGFEARVQEEVERARRFSLPVGLLLIAMPDTTNDRHALALAPLLDAVRSQLRGSDLIGRLSTGDIGALLVHTTSHGVMTVAGRVRERLSRLAGRGEIPTAVLGTAAYPAAGETAAALVQAARDSLPNDNARRSGSVASGLPGDPGTPPSSFRPAS